MKLYLCSDDINKFNSLKSIVRDNINVFSANKAINGSNHDIWVLDFEAKDASQFITRAKAKKATIIKWDIIEFIMQQAYLMFDEYPYYFMDTAFKKACSSETTTLMIGSSYGRDGFFPKLINDNCVNLAHKSQDVYYSCLIGKKVLEANPNIKDIILGTGYYFFYTDISRSKGEQEQNGLIANIYYPLFADVHHSTVKPEPLPYTKQLQNLINKKDISFLDSKKVLDYCSQKLCIERGWNTHPIGSIRRYYEYVMDNSVNPPRRVFYAPMCKLFSINANQRLWQNLSDEEKDSFAKWEADMHNTMLSETYLESLKENIQTLDSFVTFCNDKNVNLHILAMPHTKYYLKYINPQLKFNYNIFLDKIKGDFFSYDFNETDIFTDEDFIDSQHMSEQGAKKLAPFIKELINN